jgi:hypothetical protein
LDEKELTSSFHEFDPIWEALNPRERTRLIHLLDLPPSLWTVS